MTNFKIICPESAQLIEQKAQLNYTYHQDLVKIFQCLSNQLESNSETELVKKQVQTIYKQMIDNLQPKISLHFLTPIYKIKHLINHYFDQIYILNLDCRPDRMKHMQEQLHNLGIYNYRRFSALYGKEEPHLSEWKKYQNVPMTRHERMRYQRKGIASPGSWAILKSMYLMIKDAQANQYQRFLVFQDDLLFHKNFHQEFTRLVNHASFPKKWKLFYLGGTQHAWSNTTIHKSQLYYHPNGTCDGAFATAIDQSIYQEMIDEILSFTLPVDSGALKTLQRRYPKESIVAYPNLAIADIRDSDLRGYRSLERFSQKFRWDLKNYDVVDNLKPKNITGDQNDW